MGYLAEGASLEQACCEAAESHSQQLAQDLNASATAQQAASSAKTKKESKGAAGASSAGSSSILVGLSCPFMMNVYQFLKFRISIRILVRRSPGLSKVGDIHCWSHDIVPCDGQNICLVSEVAWTGITCLQKHSDMSSECIGLLCWDRGKGRDGGDPHCSVATLGLRGHFDLMASHCSVAPCIVCQC